MNREKFANILQIMGETMTAKRAWRSFKITEGQYYQYKRELGLTKPKQRLPPETIAKIKELSASGVRQKEIQEQLGLSKRAVCYHALNKRKGKARYEPAFIDMIVNSPESETVLNLKYGIARCTIRHWRKEYANERRS